MSHKLQKKNRKIKSYMKRDQKRPQKRKNRLKSIRKGEEIKRRKKRKGWYA